jgi:predicted nucleotidyltransferase
VATTTNEESGAQLDAVVELIGRVLVADLLGAYLYGSAVAGGLQHRSDLDVLAVSRRPTSLAEKQRLIERLMPLSGPKAAAGPARHLEVSILVQSDVRPWRYPPPLDFQYGDWFRGDYGSGDMTPWASPNADVAVLVTTALGASRTLAGPPLEDLLDPVPRADLDRAMLEGIPGLLADLDDDTANVMLTLARIWTTLATGEIRPKDSAADFALARLPEANRDVLARSQAVYLGETPDTWDDLRSRVRQDADVVVAEIGRVGA